MRSGPFHHSVHLFIRESRAERGDSGLNKTPIEAHCVLCRGRAPKRLRFREQIEEIGL